MGKRSILLVDDHAVLRPGLRLLVGSDPAFEIIGEAVVTYALDCALLKPDAALAGTTGASAST